jgi:mono/diheme cytochrome c family protein
MRAALATFVFVLALAGCRGGESEEPPVHLIHNMDVQEKGKAYRKDTSGLFADGRVMREPVEGTVATGSTFGAGVVVTLDQLNTDAHFEDGVDGKDNMTFPAAVKVEGKVPDTLADRGRSRYQIYCAPCHGATGDGQGTVAGLALDGGPRLLIPPPAMTSERVTGAVAGRIYAAIKNGVNNGNMPSYASQIPVEDRWAIVAYVRRDLQKLPYEGGEAIKDTGVITVASAEAGKALYKSKICFSCHSIDGSKIVGPSFKGLYGSKQPTDKGEVVADDAYLKESMLQPGAKIVTGFPPAMPQLALTDIEVQSLTLFIASLK